LIGLPLAYLASRRPTLLNLGCLQAAYAGYVLPGPVAALAVLVLFTKLAPVFYGSLLILIVAYVIHFLPAGLQSLEPALQHISPNLEEVARTLGLGMRDTWRRVTLPLVRNGFIAAWILMFLQTIKEEEYYQLAAPSALLIVLLSLPALVLLVSKDWRAA
jgi:iron(III) transport system permease protein